MVKISPASVKLVSLHRQRHVANKSFDNTKDLNRHMAIMRKEMKKGKTFLRSHAIAVRDGPKSQRKLSNVKYP